MGWFGRVLAGVAAGALLAAGSAAIAGEKRSEAPAQTESQEGERAVPLEPVLVQGFVKEMSSEQLTLTAPGAPADLPLTLDPETRFIQGEADVARKDVEAGQLVRAALLPVGEELIALVVEVVPEEPAAVEEPDAPQAPEKKPTDEPGEAPEAGPTQRL